jgi:hypothetical protein
MQQIVKTLIAITRLLALYATSATALSYGDWHVVTLPSGSTDAVWVAHPKHATYCDFAIHNNLDVKLVGINEPWRAGVPTANS